MLVQLRLECLGDDSWVKKLENYAVYGAIEMHRKNISHHLRARIVFRIMLPTRVT